jgi:signal transduction histidine kinase
METDRIDTEPRAPWPGAPQWTWERPRRRPRRRVAFLAVLTTAIQVTGGIIASRPTGLAPLAVWLLVIGPMALLLRRSVPVAGYAIALLATYAYLALDYPRGPFFLAALFALSAAVKRGPRRAVWLLTVGGYVVSVLSTVNSITIAGHSTQPASLGQHLAVAAWTGVALVLTELNRARSEYFAEMTRTRGEASRARQEQTRRQASDERLRIARELHDVLGHHLSLINVRAGVALHLLDSQPEQAREALGAIKLASSEALREVRTVLATLNPDDEAPPRSPAPGLSDVDRLAQDTRDAGNTVHIEETGQVRAIPGEVDRAAYRIVREALTNVRRHAGPGASVTVAIGYGQAELSVRVDDAGVGPPSTSDSDPAAQTGNGIPGMRERAAALGGTLATGPRPGGGFRVEAWLPIPVPSEPAGTPSAEQPPATAPADEEST